MASPSRIASLQFDVQTDAARRALSRVQVTSIEQFNGELPVVGGIFDARMGTTDMSYNCLTCRHGRKKCPGHFGGEELRAAVMTPLFQDSVRRWLRVVCPWCGALLVTPKSDVPPMRRLLVAASDSHAGTACGVCGKVAPKVSQDPQDNFVFLFTMVQGTGENAIARAPVRVYPYQAATILERVHDDSVAAMGSKTHPRNLFIRSLLVPPVSIRPGVRMAAGRQAQSSLHDINTMLQYVIKKNSQLPERMPAPGEGVSAELAGNLQVLQQLVAELHDRDPARALALWDAAGRDVQYAAAVILACAVDPDETRASTLEHRVLTVAGLGGAR